VSKSDGPNVVVVMVDDQSRVTFNRDVMPRTFDMIDDGGTELRGYALPPLCCPSRAGFLTGQYPHNHGVLANHWGMLKDPENTLPDWLDAAGYRTGFFGKYLNRFTPSPKPATGFDSWFEIRNAGYYEYKYSDNGKPETAGDDGADYSTTVLTQRSLAFLYEKSEAPFFLYTSYVAPHTRKSDHPTCGNKSPEPLDRDWQQFRDAPIELPAGYNEQDVSDKPRSVRNLKALPDRYARIEKDHLRCTMAAMRAVDRGVGDLRSAIDEIGAANNTVFIYLSDNGYYFGEHRIRGGKTFPYDEAARVPMVIDIPAHVLGEEPVAKVGKAVANIDVAPTILELAGVEPCRAVGDCRVMDGRSFAGLLRGDDEGWPDDRGLLMEVDRGCYAYGGVIRRNETYIEFPGPNFEQCGRSQRELYDSSTDPAQLQSLLQHPTEEARARARVLREELGRLSRCRGIEGRDKRQGDAPFC